MQQEQVKPQRKRPKIEELSELEAKESESAKEAKEKTDKLLDEIDDILEDTVEVEEDKPLTLGDLVREGSKLSKQAIGSFGDGVNTTCVLSAAQLAARERGLKGG